MPLLIDLMMNKYLVLTSNCLICVLLLLICIFCFLGFILNCFFYGFLLMVQMGLAIEKQVKSEVEVDGCLGKMGRRG